LAPLDIFSDAGTAVAKRPIQNVSRRPQDLAAGAAAFPRHRNRRGMSPHRDRHAFGHQWRNETMSNLTKRRGRLRRLVLAAAAVGCSAATLSGTLAAMTPGTRMPATPAILSFIDV
jgi:hypothetical protein